MINVYAPSGDKTHLWDFLSSFMNSNDGQFIIFGDFSATRFPFERLGSSFNELEAAKFNTFINSNGLIDIPMSGYKFTRISSKGDKLSKQGRFLASTHIPMVESLSLPLSISDHRPILLRQSSFDYGPSPFKLYNSWLGGDGFNDLMLSSWNETSFNLSRNPITRFKQKLRRLKQKIKVWSKSTNLEPSKARSDLNEKNP
jgi:hypothetical protein